MLKESSYKPLYILIILSIILIFPRLGENVLQTDEGSDSFYSSTILKYGYPATNDGLNEFTGDGDIGGVWKQQPWFPFYVRALSLYIFGQNSFAARLPSALLGVLSVPLLFFLTIKISKNRNEAFIATLLFICSVPLLLYFRTARYIAFQIPLLLLVIWFYIRMVEQKKWSALGFVASSVLLFHTMYVMCAGVMFGILLHLFVYEKDINRKKQFFIPFLTIFLFSAPWIAYIYPVFEQVNNAYVFRTGGIPYKLNLLALVKRFGAFLFQINNYVFPLILLFFTSRKFYNKATLVKHNYLPLLAIVIIFTIGISTLNYIPLQQYIAGILPLFYIFTSRIICSLRSAPKPAITALIVGLLIFSNVIHVGPLYAAKGIDYLLGNNISDSIKKINYFKGPVATFNWQTQFKSVMLQYIYEITHQYKGPLDGIVKYVKEHGAENDSFLMNHENISFAFHTKMRRISKIPLSEPPDWIILRKDSPIGAVLRKTAENREEANKRESFNKKYIFDYLENNNYQKIILDYPARRVNNVFEIQLHKFKTPKSKSNAIIYKYIGATE